MLLLLFNHLSPQILKSFKNFKTALSSVVRNETEVECQKGMTRERTTCKL